MGVITAPNGPIVERQLTAVQPSRSAANSRTWARESAAARMTAMPVTTVP
jgi:hypothetical protein